MLERVWCARQDLNLHALRHYHLKESFGPRFIGISARHSLRLRFGCGLAKGFQLFSGLFVALFGANDELAAIKSARIVFMASCFTCSHRQRLSELQWQAATR